jgi:menaquinone-dependent protoporphyrinogen oxidase
VARVLIAYHSGEGQTAKISERIASVLREQGHDVDVTSVESAPLPDDYQVVVIGDPIHATHHSHAMIDYIRRHVAVLNERPSAFFQVSLASANPDDEHTAAAHELVQKLLDDTGFEPDIVGMFAGALVYTRYGWFTRRMMRFIVKREGGDTDMTRDYEYTDWQAVDEFATHVGSIAHGDRR